MSTKKPVRETASTHRGLAFLIESELEKAEVVLAAKAILEKLQGMAEDLAKVEANDIMPMLDGMRLTFGPELADAFNETTTAKLRQTTEAIKAAKDTISSEVAKLENSVNGGMSNDMAMGHQTDDAPMGDDFGLDDEDMGDMDAGADMGDDADMGDEAAGMDDLDAAFDDAAQENTAAGRARKESVENNVKALRESKNPDRLIYETFRRTLKEAKNAVVAAKAVAEAFAIDLNDVIDIVKEGKTFKDEKGKTSKNKDRSEDRAHKKRNRPSDLDEGKTFKDEKGKSNKNKDRSEDRKRKNRERDLEESKRPFDSRVVENGPASKKACPDCGSVEVVSDDQGQNCQKCQWTPAGNLDESLVNRMKPRKTLGDLSTRTLDLPDSATALKKASSDFKSHIGRTMEVPYVYALVDGEPRQFNARPQDPFVVRVANTENELIGHWEGIKLEPRWRVQIVDGKGHLPPNIKKGWVDGPSYRVQRREQGR